MNRNSDLEILRTTAFRSALSRVRPGSTDSGGVMGGNSRWSMGWGVGSAGGHASVPGGAGFAGLGVLGAGGPDRQVQIGSRRSRAST
jgi:hypothetical protein